ncbi:glycosyltransferase family 2 protein [Lachnospiraceae bacterium 48-21]
MDGKIKFSILIAAYNVEKYLGECLDSIVRQSFDAYEIIIIDDGSEDGTGIIVDEYSRKYKKIKSFHWENHGLILSRRKALSMAIGEYVIFLDADDFHIGETLSVLYELIKDEKPDVILYRFRFFYEDGMTKDSKDFGKYCYRNEKEELFTDLALNYEYNHLVCKAIRREIMLKDSSEYRKFAHIKLGEDLLQTILIFAYADKVIMSDKILYGYRVLGKSMSHSFHLQQILDINTVYEYFEKYLEEQDFFSSKLHKSLCLAYIRKLASIMRDLWESNLVMQEKIKVSTMIMQFRMMEKSLDQINQIALQNRVLIRLVKGKHWYIALIYNHLLNSFRRIKR